MFLFAVSLQSAYISCTSIDFSLSDVVTFGPTTVPCIICTSRVSEWDMYNAVKVM